MLRKISCLLKRHPLRCILNTFANAIIAPLKYGVGKSYDARRYWHDRYSKYGLSLRGSGNRQLSEEENISVYKEAAKVFIEVCQKESINFQTVTVLDIGCGTGYYTQLLKDLGVKYYVGLDITDVLFTKLRVKFPECIFIRKDITTERIDRNFDLIVMIDVIEHVVREDRLQYCMENIKNCITDNGVFILAPIFDVSKRHLSYVRYWSKEDIAPSFHKYTIRRYENFSGGYIYVIRKSETSI